MMPITCGACGVAYSPSVARCPICRGYETPVVYLRTWAEAEAERQLSDDISVDDVLTMLVTNCFAEQDAVRKIQAIQKRLRRQKRVEGTRRCLLSAGMLVLGLFVIAAAVAAGPRLHSLFLFVIGGLVVASSLTAFVNGLLAVLAGRDDLIVADALPGTKSKEITA